MKPALTLVVRSCNGDAAALAAVAARRAVELGLAIDVVAGEALEPGAAAESVTAVVPAEFAVAQHAAWCLLCHLSLLRCGVAFSILVLGGAAHAAFVRRQQLAQRGSELPAPARSRRASA